jgi:hypothetical protein
MVSLRALLAAATLAAGPAHAFEPPARAEALLARGRPYVDVRPDPGGASGLVRAAIDVPASLAVVWAVMTDCEAAPRMVSGLKSCRILERDPDGRWDVREEVTRMTFMPSVRTVYREEFQPPDRMVFHRVGGDLDALEGEWRLEPRGEVVRVLYEARVGAPFQAPGWAARMVARVTLPNALLALRREAVARAHEG